VITSRIGAQQGAGGPDRTSYEFKELSRRNDAISTLQHFGNVLFRLQYILEAQGKGY
jgi:hypothetical protein